VKIIITASNKRLAQIGPYVNQEQTQPENVDRPQNAVNNQVQDDSQNQNSSFQNHEEYNIFKKQFIEDVFWGIDNETILSAHFIDGKLVADLIIKLNHSDLNDLENVFGVSIESIIPLAQEALGGDPSIARLNYYAHSPDIITLPPEVSMGKESFRIAGASVESVVQTGEYGERIRVKIVCNVVPYDKIMYSS